MLETQKLPQSELGQKLEDTILDFKTEEALLSKDLIFNHDNEDFDNLNNTEISFPQKVEKISKGQVRFPYEYNDHLLTFILIRRGDEVFVKLDDMPTYDGRPMDNEFKQKEKAQRLKGKTIDANTESLFLKGLGGAIDDIFGKSRASAADKAKEAYKLLGFK